MFKPSLEGVIQIIKGTRNRDRKEELARLVKEFSELDLSGVELYGANLSEANLTGWERFS